MGLRSWLRSKFRRTAADAQPGTAPSRGPALGVKPTRRPLFSVAGIDYGTCFTKVVIQEENIGVIEVVKDSYGEILHPSLIGYENGVLYSPQAVNASNVLPYLKMLASEKGPAGTDTLVFSDEVRALQERPDWADVLHGMLAWQFLHIVKQVRTHLQDAASRLREFDDSPDGPGDQISLNLGIPEVETESGTKQIMVSALRTAAAIHKNQEAATSDYMGLDEWLTICSSAMAGTTYQDTVQTICGYPEVAAGIQAVLRSPNAADGIYITVDVGGGTVDMNVFRRTTPAGGFRDPHECLGYYAADVSPWGAERWSGAPNPFGDTTRLGFLDDTRWGLDPATRREVYNGFKDQVEQVMAFAKTKQPNEGRPPARRTYDDSLIYLWGGGAGVADYRSCLTRTLRTDIREPVIRNLPIPEQLRKAVGDVDPTRFAVSFGLSHPAVNLSRIKPPDAFADIPRPRTRRFCPQEPGDPGYWTMDSPD